MTSMLPSYIHKGTFAYRTSSLLVMKFAKQSLLSAAVSLLVLPYIGLAQDTNGPTASQDANDSEPSLDQKLAWWRDGKLGLFLHWGAYSQEGGSYKGQGRGYGEWLMFQARIPIKEFEAYAANLNPVKFDADAWVRYAKDAGMSYIVVTAKHHDGFAMYHSASDKYNIYDLTSFKRDPLKELSDACARQGVKFCVYYSLGRDWHDPDVPTMHPVKGGRSNTWDFPNEDAKVFSRYFERKVKPQVRELLTGYGPIGILWFDTPEEISIDESKELRDMIHSLQPNCIINERIGHGQGDYAISEQKLNSQINLSPWEGAMTMAQHWSYNKYDKWKSPDDIIHLVVDAVSKGGNFLINVGPTGEGLFPQEAVDRLAALGRWMKINGEAIKGTRPWKKYGEGPSTVEQPAPDNSSAGVPKGADVKAAKVQKYTSQDIRFTTKGDILYAIALGWPADGKLDITSLADGSPEYPETIGAVELLGGQAPVTFQRDATGLHVDLPADKPCDSAYVLKISPRAQ